MHYHAISNNTLESTRFSRGGGEYELGRVNFPLHRLLLAKVVTVKWHWNWVLTTCLSPSRAVISRLLAIKQYPIIWRVFGPHRNSIHFCAIFAVIICYPANKQTDCGMFFLPSFSYLYSLTEPTSLTHKRPVPSPYITLLVIRAIHFLKMKISLWKFVCPSHSFIS